MRKGLGSLDLIAILWEMLSVPDVNKRQSHTLLSMYFSCLIQISQLNLFLTFDKCLSHILIDTEK